MSVDALQTDEQGQTMAEYAVVLGMISITIVIAIGALSGAIGTGITTVVKLFP
jgi:Flp pilus assembly pilin Flp